MTTDNFELAKQCLLTISLQYGAQVIFSLTNYLRHEYTADSIPKFY